MCSNISHLLSTGIISRVSNNDLECSVVIASKAALMTTEGSGINCSKQLFSQITPNKAQGFFHRVKMWTVGRKEE